MYLFEPHKFAAWSCLGPHHIPDRTHHAKGSGRAFCMRTACSAQCPCASTKIETLRYMLPPFASAQCVLQYAAEVCLGSFSCAVCACFLCARVVYVGTHCFLWLLPREPHCGLQSVAFHLLSPHLMSELPACSALAICIHSSTPTSLLQLLHLRRTPSTYIPS